MIAAAPRLEFAVDRVAAVEHAAVPTLGFELRIDSDADVRSLSLNAQLRIEAPRRAYDEEERRRLAELFGGPEQWSSGLRSLLWTHAAVNVPPFAGSTTAELTVPLTYDFDVVATKYLHALGEDGAVPLALLFSGSVFYAGADGRLQAARVSWDCEAACSLPVRVWRDALERAFPGAAWLRLGSDAFERLRAYRAAEALPSWDAALERLLEQAR